VINDHKLKLLLPVHASEKQKFLKSFEQYGEYKDGKNKMDDKEGSTEVSREEFLEKKSPEVLEILEVSMFFYQRRKR